MKEKIRQMWKRSGRKGKPEGGTQLGDALYTALTNRSPKSEPTTTQGRIKEILKACDGNTAKAAEMLGVARRTVQKWDKGDQEAKDTKRARNATKLERAVREIRIKDHMRQRMARSCSGAMSGADGSAKSGLAIQGWIQVSQTREYRWINPGPYLPPEVMEYLIASVVMYGPQAAADILNGSGGARGWLAGYVEGMEILSVDAIKF